MQENAFSNRSPLRKEQNPLETITSMDEPVTTRLNAHANVDMKNSPKQKTLTHCRSEGILKQQIHIDSRFYEAGEAMLGDSFVKNLYGEK